jgi:L-glyceraldehyde 3-phosphate reductase
MTYIAAPDRYDDKMPYRRCGVSGIKLPEISFGLWQNFGEENPLESQRAMIRRAFDRGVTHFDLANNYGPPYGSAESNFGEILRTDLRPYRDQLIISTKAGYDMWPGPYGEWGSRKYLLASLDQSLARMGLDYVDIFYSHRFDPDTPLEETMGALHTAVTSGRALYAGISSYSAERTTEAAAILRAMGTPVLIHQPSYSMLNRWVEGGLLDVLGTEGIGCIAFSPLAQGLLTSRYLNGIPAGSRASRAGSLSTDPRARPIPERDREIEGPVAGADGAVLGAARPARHLGADRRQQHHPARREPRRRGPVGVHGGGAGRDRPAGCGRRHQYLVGVERGLSQLADPDGRQQHQQDRQRGEDAVQRDDDHRCPSRERGR